MPQQQRTGGHARNGRAVDERFVVARANYRQPIGMTCQLGKQGRDFQARLAMPRKRKWRRHQLAVRRLHELQRNTLGVEALRQELPIVALQLWLGVERLQVARPAGHKEENDVLGLGGKM